MDKPSDILEGALLSGRWVSASARKLIRHRRRNNPFEFRCPLSVVTIEHGGEGELDKDGVGYSAYTRKKFGMSEEDIEAVKTNADIKAGRLDPIAHLRSLGF